RCCPVCMYKRSFYHLWSVGANETKYSLVPALVRGRVPLTYTRLGYIWMDARESVAGLAPLFRFHDLRHTGLTIFAQEGATLAELMRRGGHSDIRVVLRYQHATMARDRELADRTSKRAAARTAEAMSPQDEPDSDSDGHL